MKRNDYILIFCLILIYIVTYLVCLGNYPLLDPDETRYVEISKKMFESDDYMTLILNGEYFFEKPPLYFWLECLSFRIFGNISELTARLPIVLLSILPASLLFCICRKVKDTKFAFINTAILLTSLEYLILTKMAILDSILTSFVSSAVICYFYTYFAEENKKEYFRIFTYIFTAGAVLAKGLPGLFIPFLVIFVSSVIFKTYKETLKYSFWGIIIFLIITLPWHLLMLKIHNPLFFNEYIYKHHILRFLGSDIINRQQPFYFYFLILLWGFFPYIFSLFFEFCERIKKNRINKSVPNNNFDKFIILNSIAVIVILLFFSVSKTKLLTYILPVYPFLAVITGEIWYNYIYGETESKSVINSFKLINIVMIFLFVLSFFIKLFIPQDLYEYLKPVVIIFSITTGIYLILCYRYRKNKLMKFMSLAIFMALTSGFCTPYIYKFDYSFGQNDLMTFAEQAKEKHYTISAYNTGRRYSLLYYSGSHKVDFKFDDIQWLKNELTKKNNLLIVRNKEILNIPFEVKVKEKGVKYSIIGKK